MSGQLTLDFPELGGKRNPFACAYAVRPCKIINGGVLCCLHGETVTNCRASVAGDPPRCTYEQPDNSPEACARRRAFMKNGG